MIRIAEWVVPVTILLVGMIFNWYLQRREFRGLREMHQDTIRILDGIKDILDRMATKGRHK